MPKAERELHNNDLSEDTSTVCSGTEELMDVNVNIKEILIENPRHKGMAICKQNQPLKKIIGILNQKLTEHYRYYRISYNL